MRIVQFSDTHISHLGGAPGRNMSLLVEHINNEVRPDLAINTGDIVVLNPDSAEDRETARDLHQRIQVPFRVVPGNHDVGESADEPWMGIAVSSDRIAGFVGAWGPDRFLQLGTTATGSEGWAFVGINSERLGSGLPEENEQWQWLDKVAADANGKSVMLFLHKPLWYPGGSRSGITVPERDRERLLALFGAQLRVVANGHVHRYGKAFETDVLNVWAPSLTFASPADAERGLGPSESGFVEYRIDGDTVEANFQSVPGLRGVEDAMSMPEIVATLAELEASSAV